jgi:hypothetical protein
MEGASMEVESIAEQLYFFTVRIETENIAPDGRQIKGAGTGFILSYGKDNKEDYFLVTNKHVIDGAKKIHLFFIQGDGKYPLLGKAVSCDIDNPGKVWFYHPDKEIDVAVMPLGWILKELKDQNKTIFFKAITKDIIPFPETNDLDAIEEITFIGYPNDIYDTVNYLPIVRKGSTATPIKVDYSGRPCFLIDASIFPGSSGSPVFVFNRGFYPNKTGGISAGGDRLIFLGIISGGYTRNEIGNWAFIDIPTAITPVINTQQWINLGVVIKKEKIYEAIDALLKSKGELK